jgi:hypothetical protein
MIKLSLSTFCLAAMAGLSSLAGLGAKADCTLHKLAELRVVVENDQILIPATIGGQHVNALFDTGFPTTIIPSSAADRLGVLASRTSQPSYFNARTPASAAPGGLSDNAGMVSNDDLAWGDIDELVLDKITMKGARAGIIHSTRAFVGNDVSILLGNDIWRDFDIEVDLSRNLITVYRASDCGATGALAYWGASTGYNVIDLAKAGPGTAFDVKLNGRTLYAVLDSGSPHSSLTEKAAARLGLDRPDSAPVVQDTPPPGTNATDLLSMIVLTRGFGLRTTSPNVLTASQLDFRSQIPRQYWMAHLDSLTIDQEVVSPLAMRVVPNPRLVVPETGERTHRPAATYDVLLGVDFFRSHRILIAHSQGKIYFSYSGGADFGKP